jgi:hypothetical protein
MGAAIFIAIAMWCGVPSPMYSTDANHQIHECRREMLECINKNNYRECFTEQSQPLPETPVAK